MIDKSSPIPVYYQLKQAFLENIQKGIWCEGQCIESERQLSERYNVSRMTIRQALGELVQEGMLVREKGKGTFVCEHKVQQKDMMSFSEIVKNSNKTLKTKVLEFEQIDTPEDLLSFFPYDKLYRINRMRIVNGEAVANEIVYIPCQYSGRIDEHMLEGSLFEILAGRGYEVDYCESSIQAVLIDKRLKQLFNITYEAPLLKTINKTFTKDERVLFLEEAIYRSDKYILQVNMLRREGKIK